MSKFVSSKENGSVLIIIIWICLGLVSLTLVFGHTMAMAFRGSDNELAGRQSDLAIEGASRYIMTFLATPESFGIMPTTDSYQSNKVALGESYFWLIGRPDSSDASGQITYGIIDEASKINLNTATRTMLEALPGMTPELAAAIIDWRDTNSDVTPGGAENETYARMSPPRLCKNAPFETVEELLMVNGMTEQILYGEDLNRNGVLDPNENDADASQPSDNADGKLDRGLIDYVTVFTRESNKRSSGERRINVSNVTGRSNDLRNYLNTTLGTGRGDRLQNRRYGSVLEFCVRNRFTVDETDKIFSDLTVSNAETLPGKINVNTASEAVLACVPGIDKDKASQIIAARMTRKTTTGGIGWIVNILGNNSAIAAGPYLTSQSWQETVDIASTGRHGRGYRRTLFVIDRSGDAPEVVYRRNLSGLGWALGADVRQALITTSTGGHS